MLFLSAMATTGAMTWTVSHRIRPATGPGAILEASGGIDVMFDVSPLSVVSP